MTSPIDLFYWPTPNGWKISIALEELGLPYTVRPVNIGVGDQFQPDFLKFSPNNKMPAIIDPEGPEGRPISIFESGAILIYLAEKTGRLMPADPRGRYAVLEWLMFQMGGVGPMLGQAHHFRQYAPEKIQYAIDRYTNEAGRLYNVLDKRLSETEWVAGDEYSIADIAIFPWIVPHERQGQSFDERPHLKRWYETMKARPAVSKGLDVGKELRSGSATDPKAFQTLFGAAQYQKR
ncbi:MAG: glutathione S-transferase [Tistrella sp.]|uniref:Glutathione S-transferase n=1 Tax=Tistrella mobilis TaxID=171437 RepID=A0A3B9IW55_9PROT|nr:glutathione binding-like protein [Tistrella sp.]MAD35274.1 glutathione S-transferase [Tistrella sp.]MBA75238.1 glutathione S-transferase [Tistrella sp.]HAE51483.1 glutathione S-transferase [Tistrella mobilis]